MLGRELRAAAPRPSSSAPACRRDLNRRARFPRRPARRCALRCPFRVRRRRIPPARPSVRMPTFSAPSRMRERQPFLRHHRPFFLPILLDVRQHHVVDEIAAALPHHLLLFGQTAIVHVIFSLPGPRRLPGASRLGYWADYDLFPRGAIASRENMHASRGDRRRPHGQARWRTTCSRPATGSMYFDTAKEPLRELEKEGAAVAASAKDAFKGDAVISMLPNDDAMRAVFVDGDVLPAGGSPTIHVNMATASVACAEELTALHRKRGVPYVAATVWGRPDAAAAAKLSIAVAGDRQSNRPRAAAARRGRSALDVRRRRAGQRQCRQDRRQSDGSLRHRGHGGSRRFGARLRHVGARFPRSHRHRAVRGAGLSRLCRADRQRRSTSRPVST